MAGSYPDAPGVKFAYEADGSAGFTIVGGVVTALTSVALTAANNENADVVFAMGASTAVKIGVVFPQLRDLAGYFVQTDSTNITSGIVETSTDTTNGLDGVWTSRGTGSSSQSVSGYRTVTALAQAGIKAVRFTLTNTDTFTTRNIQSLHLYGTIPVTSTPDRLTLWHPTLDQALSPAGLDFGDVQRGTTNDKTFRVKNLSSTLTANTVQVSLSALTDTAPTVLSQETLGIAGSFAATQTITSIAPTAISAVVTLRLAVSASAALSVNRQRVTAAATTWS